MAQTDVSFVNCRQVAVFLDPANEYDAGVLDGVKQYAREHPGWSLVWNELRPDADLSWLARWRGHGLLGRFPHARLAGSAARLQLPSVALDRPGESPHSPHQAGIDAVTAELGADYLLERGIRSLAVYAESPHGAAPLFEAYAAERGCPCAVFPAEEAGRSEIERKMRIVRWLGELPKPVGLLACSREGLLLDACRMAGCQVPEEAAVIGFMPGGTLGELIDDQLFTVIASPLKIGYRAAALLDRMMDRLEREEEAGFDTALADPAAAKDELVAGALDYIRRNACGGMTVADLLEELPLSRRMLEYRFRKALGRSPHEEIMTARLSRVKQLLAETALPLVAIADRSGFKHTEYLSVAFKREVGLTPGRYRKLHQS